MTEQGGTKQAEQTKHVVRGKWSPGEVVDSLTGPEEDAIVAHFGAEVAVLMVERRPTKARRALLFVLHRRDGANPAVALKASSEATSGEVYEFFRELDDDEDGDDSETESGNGVRGAVSEPTTTPASGSASGSDRPTTTP